MCWIEGQQENYKDVLYNYKKMSLASTEEAG